MAEKPTIVYKDKPDTATPQTQDKPNIEFVGGLDTNYEVLTTPAPTVDPKLQQLLQPIDFKDVYAYAGPNEGFLAKYPTYLRGRNNEAFAASQQSTGEVIGNTLLGFGTLAFNSFFNHWGSTFTNLNKLANQDFGTLYDSAISEYAADQSLGLQYKYPIYQTSEEQLYNQQNRGAGAAFGKFVPFSGTAGRSWARLIQQLGFTAGTLGAVALEEVALAAATAEIGGAGALARLPRNLYKIYRSLPQVFKLADTMEDFYSTTQTIGKLGKSVFYGIRMANTASGEARLEANIAAREFEINALNQITEEGRIPTAQEIKNIQEKAANVGDLTFGWNMPILTVSNLFVIPNIIKPRGLSAGRGASFGSRVVSEGNKWYTQKELIKTSLGKFKYDAFNFFKKVPGMTIAEGLEEVGQGIGSRSAQQYYSLPSNDYGKSNRSFISVVGDEIAHTFGSGEGWDELASGMITGLLMGGLGGAIQTNFGRKTEKESKKIVELLNKAQTDLLFSINNQNLNEQVAAANEGAQADSEGNVKKSKDLRSQAKSSFFQTLRRSAKDEQGIDELIEHIRVMQVENPSVAEELLGGKKLEEYSSELKDEYKQYNKWADIAETLFVKESPNEVTEYIVQQFASALVNAKDARSRMDNILSDINSQISSTKNGAKVSTLMSTILDPDTLDTQISTLQTTVDSTKTLLKEAELSAADKKLQEKTLEQDEAWLNTLKSIQEDLYNKDYSPEIVADKLVNTLVKFDPSLDVPLFRENVNDFINLSAEQDQLIFFSNALRNEEFRKGFSGAIERARGEAKKKVLQQQEEPVNVSTEEVQVDIDPEIAGSTIQKLNSIKKTVEGYLFDGIQYKTREEAEEAVLRSMGDDISIVEPVFSDLKTQAAQIRQQPKERNTDEVITDQEYDDFKNGSIPQEVIDKLDQKNPVDYSPRELEIVEAYNKNNSKTKTEEVKKKELLPKTIEQVRNASPAPVYDPTKGLITNFYDIAVARVWGLKSKIIQYLKSSNIKEALDVLQKDKDITVTTISLNDQLIPDAVLEKDVTPTTLKKAFDNNGIAVVLDKRGRYVIFTEGDKNQARKAIQDKLKLTINNGAFNSFSEVRNEDGQVISSNFNQEEFTTASKREVNKLVAGDNVELVIPNNSFNQKLLQKFRNTSSEDPTVIQKRFDDLRDNLLIEVRSNNQVVGVIRAGDYYLEGEEIDARLKAFRDKYITPSILPKLKDEVSLGTIQVQEIAEVRRVNYDTAGDMVFTTIKEYEEQAKANPDLELTFDYFVGTSSEVATNKKGKTINRTSLARKAVFREGAIYAYVKNNVTGEYSVFQLLGEEAKQYTVEDLNKDDFKTELQTNLVPGESPLISKRVVINNKVDLNIQKNLREDTSEKPTTVIEEVTTETEEAPQIKPETIKERNERRKKLATAEPFYDDTRTFVLQFLLVNKLHPDTFRSETGFGTKNRGKDIKGRSEFASRLWAISKKGMTIDQAVRSIAASMGRSYQNADVASEIRNELISVITDFDSKEAIYSELETIFEYDGVTYSSALDMADAKNMGDYSQSYTEVSEIPIGIDDDFVLENEEEINELYEETDRAELTQEEIENNAKEYDEWFNELTEEEQQQELESYESYEEQQRLLESEEMDADTRTDETEGQEQKRINVVVNGEEIPLTNVKIDKDNKTITGTDPQGNEQIFSELDIDETKPYSTDFIEEPTSETIQEVADEQREEWILLNGEVGVTYITEDGTEIRIISRDENSTTIVKNGFIVQLDKQGEIIEVRDVEGITNEVLDNPPTNSELLEILKSPKNGLSLRQHIITRLYFTQLLELKSQLETRGTSYEDYLPKALKEQLYWLLGENAETFLLTLTQKYNELLVTGQEPQTMSELMEATGFDADSINYIKDGLGFGAYIKLWNFVTQAKGLISLENSKIPEQDTELTEQLDMVENMDSTKSPDKLVGKTVDQMVRLVKRFLSKNMLFANGMDDLKDRPEKQIKEIATLFKTFSDKITKLEKAEDLVLTYLELNTELRPYGISLDLSRLAKAESMSPKTAIMNEGRTFFMVNDSADLFMETNDQKLSEQEGILLVPNDEGNMVQVEVSEITAENREAVQNDLDFLKQIGYEVSEDYVAAYHQVNYNTTSLLNRAVQQEKSEEFNNVSPQSSEVVTDTFDKEKALREASKKTCK